MKSTLKIVSAMILSNDLAEIIKLHITPQKSENKILSRFYIIPEMFCISCSYTEMFFVFLFFLVFARKLLVQLVWLFCVCHITLHITQITKKFSTTKNIMNSFIRLITFIFETLPNNAMEEYNQVLKSQYNRQCFYVFM